MGCAVPGCAAMSSVDSTQSDAAFLKMAAEADMAVAHMGQMAEKQASASEVKNLAETLVRDHTNDYQRLTALATKVGLTIPKAIDKQNEQAIMGLKHDQGKNFDHAFLLRQSKEHEKLIDAFKHEAEHGENPDIKAYASGELPTIERHLHDAQNLIKQRS